MLTMLQCAAAHYSWFTVCPMDLANADGSSRTKCSHPCHRRGTVQGVRPAVAAHYQGARHLEGTRAVRCAPAATVSSAGAVGTVRPGKQRGRCCLGAEWCWFALCCCLQSPYLPWDAKHAHTFRLVQLSLQKGLLDQHSSLTISFPNDKAARQPKEISDMGLHACLLALSGLQDPPLGWLPLAGGAPAGAVGASGPLFKSQQRLHRWLPADIALIAISVSDGAADDAADAQLVNAGAVTVCCRLRRSALAC